MAPGYDQPLFILALDHRVPPHGAVFGVTGDPTPAEVATIIDAKSVIFDGFARAIDHGVSVDSAGILVDEELASESARTALGRGWRCAMPVERSGLPGFELEYGDDFARHVEAFDPTFSKVLVRYNPDGDPAVNHRSITNLLRLSRWLRATDRKLLFELIVLAESSQLAVVGGDPERYDTELRPVLMRRAILELQAAGIEPDVWKVEGIDRREDCELVAATARADGRDQVGCVVLGRGADTEKVEHWLRTCAGVPGYRGFAIGRTLWWDHVRAYLDGSRTRAEAADGISAAYRRAIAVYTGTVEPPPTRAGHPGSPGSAATRHRAGGAARRDR